MKLNNSIIQQVQQYLSGMNWAQREYKGELLSAFLEGVECAYKEQGIFFRLAGGSREYYYIYHVAVMKYIDPYNCWSDKVLVGSIYEDHTEWEEAEND